MINKLLALKSLYQCLFLRKPNLRYPSKSRFIKSTVISTMWCWCRQSEQWNRVQKKRHIHPWILGLGKGGSAGQWERTLTPVHIAGPSDYLLRKMKFDPHLTHTQRSIPGVPHIKGKIIKLLDNMTGVSLLPWGLERFLWGTQKSLNLKQISQPRTTDIWNRISFCCRECPVHYRMFHSIPCLYLLTPKAPPSQPQSWQPKMSPRHWQMAPAGELLPFGEGDRTPW